MINMMSHIRTEIRVQNQRDRQMSYWQFCRG